MLFLVKLYLQQMVVSLCLFIPRSNAVFWRCPREQSRGNAEKQRVLLDEELGRGNRRKRFRWKVFLTENRTDIGKGIYFARGSRVIFI